jgi:hypothetical protein
VNPGGPVLAAGPGRRRAHAQVAWAEDRDWACTAPYSSADGCWAADRDPRLEAVGSIAPDPGRVSITLMARPPVRLRRRASSTDDDPMPGCRPWSIVPPWPFTTRSPAAQPPQRIRNLTRTFGLAGSRYGHGQSARVVQVAGRTPVPSVGLVSRIPTCEPEQERRGQTLPQQPCDPTLAHCPGQASGRSDLQVRAVAPVAPTPPSATCGQPEAQPASASPTTPAPRAAP